jgi:hypothetical protein
VPTIPWEPQDIGVHKLGDAIAYGAEIQNVHDIAETIRQAASGFSRKNKPTNCETPRRRTCCRFSRLLMRSTRGWRLMREKVPPGQSRISSVAKARPEVPMHGR